MAQTPEEVQAAQRLRYTVFVEEMGASASEAEHAQRLEMDDFDPYFDHLLLCDPDASNCPLEQVVGVYRLMRGSVAKQNIGFYGAGEYDLRKLQKLERETLELGRSCIAKPYRGGLGMHKLWDGLGDYVVKHDIGVLFGAASFHNADPAPIAQALSYLHHNHLAPPALRVRSKAFESMDLIASGIVDKREALRQIPALIRAYIRLGGMVGEGAFIDHDFNTVDVCLIMDTDKMVQKYRDFYSRSRN